MITFSGTVTPIIRIYIKSDWKFSSVLHKLVSFWMFQNSSRTKRSHERHFGYQMGQKVCFQHKANIYRSYLQVYGQTKEASFYVL